MVAPDFYNVAMKTVAVCLYLCWGGGKREGSEGTKTSKAAKNQQEAQTWICF